MKTKILLLLFTIFATSCAVVFPSIVTFGLYQETKYPSPSEEYKSPPEWGEVPPEIKRGSLEDYHRQWNEVYKRVEIKLEETPKKYSIVTREDRKRYEHTSSLDFYRCEKFFE